MASGIRWIPCPIGRYWDLMMERLFLLRLWRIEGKSRGCLDVRHRDGLLRTGLMHGDGSWTALAISKVLRLWRERRGNRGRNGHRRSSSWRKPAWWPSRWQPDNRLAIFRGDHSGL